MSEFVLTIIPLLDRESAAFTTDDNGRGPSKYGVTLRSYQEFHPSATAETIRALTAETAAGFYAEAFWERYSIGMLRAQAVADKVMDLAVNCGGETAVRMLQTVVGVPVDGRMGTITVSAANAMQPAELVGGLRIAAAEHYRALVAENPALAKDLDGWLARNAKV